MLVGNSEDDLRSGRQYYVRCKEELPMEVEFMLSDSLEESFLTVPWSRVHSDRNDRRSDLS